MILIREDSTLTGSIATTCRPHMDSAVETKLPQTFAGRDSKQSGVTMHRTGQVGTSTGLDDSSTGVEHLGMETNMNIGVGHTSRELVGSPPGFCL
jgi:hypothetical protein